MRLRPSVSLEFVFPKRVGMNLATERRRGGRSGVPHACGDEPALGEEIKTNQECSPRVWG